MLLGRLLDPLTRYVLARPGAWLLGSGIVTVALCLGLGRLELRTDGAAIHPLGDPTIAHHNDDQGHFHERDHAILLVSSASGGSRIDSREGLGYLKQLHESLAEGPGSQSRMRSLANLIDPQGSIALLRSPDFLDDIDDDPASYADMMRRIDASPLARGVYLARSGHAAAFYVPTSRHRDRDELVSGLDRWVRDQAKTDFALRLTGPVTAEVLLGRAVLNDLLRLVPLVVLVMAVLLYLCTRSVAGIVVPMAEVLMVLVWTLGAMGLCGVPVTLVTTILPVLLMSIAITDEIHLLERFRARLDRACPNRESPGMPARHAAIAGAVRDVGRPIVLTSLTTSIGFLSFLSASILPVRHLGLFTALGVLLAMVLSFTFVPALLCLLPASWFREWRPRTAKPPRGGSLFQRWFGGRRDRLAIAIALLVLFCSVPGLSRLSIQDSWVDNFAPGEPLVSAERDFNREFWGSYRFDVILTGSEKRFFHTAEGLRLIEAATSVAEAAPYIGGVANHRMAYQLLADVWDERAPVHELGTERIAEMTYLLTRVQHRIDLDQVLQSNGSSARLRLFVKSADHARGNEIWAYLERELPAVLAPSRVEFHFSGDLPVAQAVVGSIVGNVLRSLGWTIVGVFVLLVILFRDLRVALATVAPLLLGIPILVGGMGYTGIPFGIATSLFVAVTIGVAVDFAIHFIHAYFSHRPPHEPEVAGVDYPRASVDHDAALGVAFDSAGRAIRWNAIVLALGLSVLSFSELKPNRQLGMLLVAAITLCYAATLLALPFLLRLCPSVRSRGSAGS